MLWPHSSPPTSEMGLTCSIISPKDVIFSLSYPSLLCCSPYLNSCVTVLIISQPSSPPWTLPSQTLCIPEVQVELHCVSSAPAHYSRPVWLGTQHCLLWVNDSSIFLLILFSMISVLDISPGVTYCHIKSSNLRSLPLLILAHLFNGPIIFNNLTNHLVPQAWISEVTFDSFLFCITYIQDVSQVLQQYPSDLTFWKLLKCSPADSTFEVSRGCVCWLITTLMHSDRYRIDA